MKNRVRELRKGLGYRQEDLARQAGVSRQTIIAVENGKYNPSLALGMKLAKVLNKRVEDLFFPAED